MSDKTFEEAVDQYIDATSHDQFEAVRRYLKMSHEVFLAHAVEQARGEQFIEGWQVAIKDAVSHLQRSGLGHGLAYDWLCGQLSPQSSSPKERGAA